MGLPSLIFTQNISNMVRNRDGSDRLYLSKGEQTIYIDNCKIAQHHIDGIRFLYRQYKKKKPGAIINDRQVGRTLPIVLFLKATRHLFDKPALVLCEEGTEHGWMDQFQTWTDLCDDIVIETQKPFIKKQILVNTMADLPAFCRRDWSVLVVDGDKSSREILGLPFRTDYKIWITSINMKDNLDKFSQLHKWLYPKETFDKTEFTPDRSNLSDVVDKAILLDAFMEDVVLRTQCDGDLKEIENIQTDDMPPLRISRKNKDATGTKIKRSKRKIYNDVDVPPQSKTKRNEQRKDTDISTPSKEVKTEAQKYKDIAEDNSIDNITIKSVELNEQTLTIKERDDEIKFDTINSQSQVALYYEPDTPPHVDNDSIYDMNTLELDVCHDDKFNDKPNNGAEVYIQCQNSNRDSEKLYIDTKNCCTNESIDNINVDIVNKRETVTILEIKSNNETNVVPKPKSVCNDITKKTSAFKSSKEILYKCDKISETDLDNNIDNSSTSNFDEMATDKILENDLRKHSPLNYDEIKPDNGKKLIENETETILNQNKVIEYTINEIDNNSSPSNCDDVTSVSNENILTNEVQTKSGENESDTVKLKRNTMEDKMKEMEEQALKKFKGSILDSLF